MSEKNGSLAGSKNVLKQSTGNDWSVDSDTHERGDGNSPRGSSTDAHGQKKARSIKHINSDKS